MSAAPATIPPGRAPVAEAHSKEEPETVSLREIETILSPGKAPPPLPARAGAPRPAIAPKPFARPAAEPLGPPRAPLESLDETAPVPVSSRWGDSSDADLAAMATLVPAPRPAAGRGAGPALRTDRPPPASGGDRTAARGLDSSKADIELMAAIAPAPAPKPPTRASWVPPPPKAKAVLSSQATAALKGAKPVTPAAPPVGAWRKGPAPLRAPAAAEGAPLVVPAPPTRAAPPKSNTVADATAMDDDWGDAAEEAAPSERSPGRATLPGPAPNLSPAPIRAMDAALSDDPRGSLPDVAGLLRDAPEPEESSGRGSVVDPLELYGAAPDAAAPRQPSKPRLEPMTSARAALAEAELKAVAVSAAVAGAKPKVDLPARVEPRPFPRPPPRRPSPSAPEIDAGRIAPAKVEAKRPAPHPMPVRITPPPPAPALKPADVEPISADRISLDDEIPIDITPDAEEVTSAPASASADSGRFDLQQLMTGGGPAPAPKPSSKGLADEDLFGLAGDLFTETSPPAPIAPPNLSALGARGAASQPPPGNRLLAPVAVSSAPEAPPAPTSTAPPAASPAPRTSSIPPAPRRSIAPWVLLPVLALGAAAIMIWRGQSSSVTPDNTPLPGTTQQGTREPDPPATTAPPVMTAPVEPTVTSSVTASSSATDSPRPPDTTTAAGTGTWKPPTTPGTGGGPTPPVTATAPATTPTTTKTTPPPTATATTPPPSAGGAFDPNIARSALRTAAGGAGGCPADHPGTATVSVTWAPSGRVTQSQVSGSFAGTTTGGCIASAMRKATIPPFEGGPQSMSVKVTVR